MNRKLAVVLVVLSLSGTHASAHKLDEYLQATILSVEADHVQAFMRLIPGVAVCSAVLSGIDTNRDGMISEVEQRAYAEQVIRDLSLTIDGHRLTTRLLSVTFPETQEMKEGLGEIQIEFRADVPNGSGADRKLIFENHHQSRIAAYLVNCLVPRNRNIRIVAQSRNRDQSFYQLDYTQTGSYTY